MMVKWIDFGLRNDRSFTKILIKKLKIFVFLFKIPDKIKEFFNTTLK